MVIPVEDIPSCSWANIAIKCFIVTAKVLGRLTVNDPMNNKIRLVIVGLGLVGRRHASAIAQVAGAELVGIVDTNEAALQFASSLGVVCTASLDEMFDRVRPQGVILATPTPLHAEQGAFCIDRRCPVLIEKPLTTNAASAQVLVEQASESDVPILVGHHRRHNPLIRKARALIDEGAIGEIRAVQAQCWFYKPDHYFESAPWRTQVGAGPLSVNLVHDVDLIRYLCGEVKAVSAFAAPSSRGFDNEEVAAAVLRFHSGAVGTITVSDGIVSPWSWELTSAEYPVYPVTDQSCYKIGGTAGSLSVPDLTLWNQQGRQDWWAPISATSVPRDSSDPLVNQIAHFLAVIQGREVPLVSGEEGLKTLRVIEAIQRSAESAGSIEPALC